MNKRRCACGHLSTRHRALVQGPIEAPMYDYGCDDCACPEYEWEAELGEPARGGE